MDGGVIATMWRDKCEVLVLVTVIVVTVIVFHENIGRSGANKVYRIGRGTKGNVVETTLIVCGGIDVTDW